MIRAGSADKSDMDQRRESRFQANQKVRVTILEPARAGIDAEIRNASGRGVGLWLRERLGPGDAVKIDLDTYTASAPAASTAVPVTPGGTPVSALDILLDGVESRVKSR